MGYCLKDLVDRIENDNRILEFRFQYKDTLIWPFIRFSVYSTISLETLKLTSTIRKEHNSSNLVRRAMKLIKNNKLYLRTPFLWEHKDILYFYNGTGNVAASNGKIYNRVYDWFVMEFNEQSGVIETKRQMKYKKDKHVDKRYLDPINFVIEILCYFGKTSHKDIIMADGIIEYLCNDCKLNLSPSEAFRIKKSILYISKRIKYIDKIFPLIFRRINPKVVFVDLGCYGNDAYLIKILHEMGIKTAEAQHGWIGRNHEAYVHSDFLCNNAEYASYMPDFFLGWSEYWLEKISIPGKKIPIGNPQFWQNNYSILKEQKKQETGDYKTILWIAFINNDENFRHLDEFIAVSNNEYYIRVRLHPSFRYLKNEYQKYENNNKIILDEMATVYDSIAMSDYVISEYSTVIYEALALGRPTYILRNEASLHYEVLDVAPGFENANELLNLLNAHNSLNYDLNSIRVKFFGDALHKKFKSFIESI